MTQSKSLNGAASNISHLQEYIPRVCEGDHRSSDRFVGKGHNVSAERIPTTETHRSAS
jgi:hypothetical protein